MAITQKIDLSGISTLSVFSEMTTSEVEQAIAGASLKDIKHREVVFQIGDDAHYFCVIKSGALKIVRPSPRGDDVIVFIATTGDVVAALVMGAELRKYPTTIQAMGPTQLILIQRATFVNYWTKSSKLQSKLNNLLYKRMTTIQEDKLLFKAPLSTRISAFLIQLLDRTAIEGHKISVPLTRQEVADALGVTVESVIRIMSEWNQNGWIRTNDKHLEILKLDQLVALIDQN